MVRVKWTTGELNVVLTLFVFEDSEPSIMLNYKTISLKKKRDIFSSASLEFFLKGDESLARAFLTESSPTRGHCFTFSVTSFHGWSHTSASLYKSIIYGSCFPKIDSRKARAALNAESMDSFPYLHGMPTVLLLSQYSRKCKGTNYYFSQIFLLSFTEPEDLLKVVCIWKPYCLLRSY